MIECDEIISVLDIVSIKMTNSIETNVTKNSEIALFCTQFY